MDDSCACGRAWKLGRVSTVAASSFFLSVSAAFSESDEGTLTEGGYYVLNNAFDPRIGVALTEEEKSATPMGVLGNIPNLRFCDGELAYVSRAEVKESDSKCPDDGQVGPWFASDPIGTRLEVVNIDTLETVVASDFKYSDGQVIAKFGDTVGAGQFEIVLTPENSVSVRDVDDMVTILTDDASILKAIGMYAN